MKGANRLAKDNEGRTAADHVPTNLPDSVRNDLIIMLVREKILIIHSIVNINI